MHEKTVKKMSEERPVTKMPTGGEPPSRQENAAMGGITKGSTGPTHTTQENKTTSTNFPQAPVPETVLNTLAEMHAAEKELTYALPLMAKEATAEDLKTLLKMHLQETEGHVKTVEAIADSLGQKLPVKSCKAMTQLIEKGEKEVLAKSDSSEKDAAIMAAGQKIEQFEIEAYTPLCATAKNNEWTHELALLTSILNQEKLAKELLAGLAAGKGPLQKLVEKASLQHAAS